MPAGSQLINKQQSKVNKKANGAEYVRPATFITSMHRTTIIATILSMSLASISSFGAPEAKNVPRLGDQAPDFELKDPSGRYVTLDRLTANGPAVIIFYRGGWCPYCNIQLREFEGALEEFRELGATVVGIAPQSPAENGETIKKNKLSYTVLSDLANEATDAFGVRSKYENRGVYLPDPATFVIDSSGTIRYAFVREDYKVRPSPDQVITTLRSLSRETSTGQ